MAWTSARPVTRSGAASARGRRQARERQAEIVGFDDQRDDAIDRGRDADADDGQHHRLRHGMPAGMAASVIAMISAERMKSVLMALATFPSSKVLASIATGSSFASCACAPCGKRNS